MVPAYLLLLISDQNKKGKKAPEHKGHDRATAREMKRCVMIELKIPTVITWFFLTESLVGVLCVACCWFGVDLNTTGSVLMSSSKRQTWSTRKRVLTAVLKREPALQGERER
jgi:hypothetical protein